MLKSTPASGTELTVGINAFGREKKNISWKCQQQQQKEERKNIIMEMSPNANMSRLLVSILTVVLFVCLFD